MDVVDRAAWGATASPGPPMRLPAVEAFLHHSVTTATGDPAADMRLLERVGVQRFGRISYSWAVHPSGTVLEGAGVTVGAHTGGRNSTSFGVVLIGNYEVDHPSRAQIDATAELVSWLVATGKLQRGAPIGGHRDVKATACPGRHAYAQLGEIRRLAANPKEEDMAHYTVYTGRPHTVAIRVAVDGAIVGFPNPAELAEFLKPYDAGGFDRKVVNFAEADEWDRFMRSGPVRADTGTARVLAALKALDDGVVDEAALAAEVAGLLLPGLVDALATELGVTVEEVEAAAERAVRRVSADAATPDPGE